MKVATLAALAGVAAAAKDQRTFAVLRFLNKQLTTVRADPIISPGVPGSHVHVVLGGSNFGLSSTGEDLQKSNCSTAMVKGDNSNYWFPLLYFRDPKTQKFEAVDVFYSNAYYFMEPTNDDIKAFPLGLQIFTGNPNQRLPPAIGATTNLDPSKGDIQNIKMTCPRDNNNFDNPPSWPTGSNGTMSGMRDPNNKGEGVGFPDVNCNGYASPLRLDVHFPSCYNPQAGLTNYKENMVFPSDAGNGKADCPKGYTHTPHMFLEVYYNTPLFQGRWTENQGTQPFVFSNGDATGYSLHSDFMSGWDESVLQHVIDTCNTGTGGMDTCPGLPLGLNTGDCTIPPVINEPIQGPLDALPGSNMVTGWQYGLGGGQPAPAPAPAPAPSSSSVVSPPAATSSKPSPVPSSPPSSPPVQSGHPAGLSASHSEGAGTTTDSSTPPSEATTRTPAVPPVQSEPPTDSSPSLPQITGSRTAESDSTSTQQTTQTVLMPSDSAPGCSPPKTTTVWQTVTVTAGQPGPPAAPTTAPPPPAPQNSTDVSGYKLVGCYQDNTSRALSGDPLPNLGAMTNGKCVDNCKAKGFKLAATEYGGQCYCGNQLEGSSKLADSACDMPCEGDGSETCGGGWALSVYSADGEVSMGNARMRRALGHLHRHRKHH